jgi:hypothetical protein
MRRCVSLVVAALVAACVAPRVRAEDCVPLADFSAAAVGAFPADWKVRSDGGRSVYTIAEEDGRRFLRARSRGHGVQAATERSWDLNERPVLAWTWRAVEFPRGANEQSGANDSVLAVYLLVPHSRIRGPKAVKYVWSERVPAGTRLESNGGLTQVKVVQSGTEARGRWVDERVNARDDYLALHGTDAVPEPAGVAVLTDSDDTDSTAQGDYANLRACRE